MSPPKFICPKCPAPHECAREGECIGADNFRKPMANVIDLQQRRGVAWDIIDEALAAYDGFMLDDDYEPYEAMRKIFGKMKERRDAYRVVAET